MTRIRTAILVSSATLAVVAIAFWAWQIMYGAALMGAMMDQSQPSHDPWVGPGVGTARVRDRQVWAGPVECEWSNAARTGRANIIRGYAAPVTGLDPLYGDDLFTGVIDSVHVPAGQVRAGIGNRGYHPIWAALALEPGGASGTATTVDGMLVLTWDCVEAP